MAETPKRAVHSTRRSKQPPSSATKPLPSLTPSTPQTSTPRRSTRLTSLSFDSETPRKQIDLIEKAIGDSVKETPRDAKTPRRKSSGIPKTPDVKALDSAIKDEKPNREGENGLVDDKVSLSPVSPEQPESRKRKWENGRTVVTRAMASKGKSSEKKKKIGSVSKKQVHYKKGVHDGGEFEVGDDVYVRRREDASSDYEDPEMEECRVCFKSGKAVMIECDDCLGGFHLKCLKPPLKEVPEGDWICWFCEARKMGKRVQLPVPPKGKKLVRTMREKLLSSDLWAARIERYYFTRFLKGYTNPLNYVKFYSNSVFLMLGNIYIFFWQFVYGCLIFMRAGYGKKWMVATGVVYVGILSLKRLLPEDNHII